MTEGAPEQPQPARGAGGPHHRTTFARAPAAVCHSSGGQAQLTRVTEADTTRPPCAVAGGNAGRVTTVRAGPLRAGVRGPGPLRSRRRLLPALSGHRWLPTPSREPVSLALPRDPRPEANTPQDAPNAPQTERLPTCLGSETTGRPAVSAVPALRAPAAA